MTPPAPNQTSNSPIHNHISLHNALSPAPSRSLTVLTSSSNHQSLACSSPPLSTSSQILHTSISPNLSLKLLPSETDSMETNYHHHQSSPQQMSPLSSVQLRNLQQHPQHIISSPHHYTSTPSTPTTDTHHPQLPPSAVFAKSVSSPAYG